MRHASSRKTLNFVGCVANGINWAIDIDHVSEIIQPIDVSPLPHASPNVLGTIRHRDSVVPVISLERWLALGSAALETKSEGEGDRRRKWILVRQDDATVGLEVDMVSEVFSASAESLRAAPQRFNREGEQLNHSDVRNQASRGAEWIVPFAENIAYVLNLDYFFGNVEAEALPHP